MKHIKYILIMLLLITMVGIVNISCGSDNVDNCDAKIEELNSLAADVQARALDYLNDMSTENCVAYRTAAKAFLDEFTISRNCVPVQAQPSYDNSVMTYEEVLDETDC